MPKHKAARSAEPASAHTTTPDSAPAYDTPWKLALEHYFPQFMTFYFPTTCAAIDWAKWAGDKPRFKKYIKMKN